MLSEEKPPNQEVQATRHFPGDSAFNCAGFMMTNLERLYDKIYEASTLNFSLFLLLRLNEFTIY